MRKGVNAQIKRWKHTCKISHMTAVFAKVTFQGSVNHSQHKLDLMGHNSCRPLSTFSTCLAVCCQGDQLFCFWVVTSTSTSLQGELTYGNNGYLHSYQSQNPSLTTPESSSQLQSCYVMFPVAPSSNQTSLLQLMETQLICVLFFL